MWTILHDRAGTATSSRCLLTCKKGGIGYVAAHAHTEEEEGRAGSE